MDGLTTTNFQPIVLRMIFHSPVFSDLWNIVIYVTYFH